MDHSTSAALQARPCPVVSTIRATPDLAREPGVASWISYVGLNATAFFLAEAGGVTMPSVNAYLRDHRWSYEAIGIATALAGLGGLLAQTPVGWLIDHIPYRRSALALASLVVGGCIGLLPAAPGSWLWVVALLVTAGLARTLFGPLVSALALALVGHDRLSRLFGINEACNHLGNIAAALSAIILVGLYGLPSVFFAVTVVSLLAAGSVLLIRSSDLTNGQATGAKPTATAAPPGRLRQLLRDRRIVLLLSACALFHLANAPVMPLVALHIKHLHGSDAQIPAVVLIAQVVMVPMALVTGWLCDRIGRKAIFAVGFIVLPLRIFSYSLAESPAMLLALQALDGIGAGIFGVASVAMCADLTRGKDGFNTLGGMIATASGVGGVAGPMLAGVLVQRWSFGAAYEVFAFIALVGAVLFLVGVPETHLGGAAARAVTDSSSGAFIGCTPENRSLADNVVGLRQMAEIINPLKQTKE